MSLDISHESNDVWTTREWYYQKSSLRKGKWETGYARVSLQARLARPENHLPYRPLRWKTNRHPSKWARFNIRHAASACFWETRKWLNFPLQQNIQVEWKGKKELNMWRVSLTGKTSTNPVKAVSFTLSFKCPQHFNAVSTYIYAQKCSATIQFWEVDWRHKFKF